VTFDMDYDVGAPIQFALLVGGNLYVPRPGPEICRMVAANLITGTCFRRNATMLFPDTFPDARNEVRISTFEAMPASQVFVPRGIR